MYLHQQTTSLGQVTEWFLRRQSTSIPRSRQRHGRPLFFHDDSSGKSKQIVLSVKGGHVEHSHIRDLRGVLDREEAQIGVLITLEPATRPMLKEAASCGFYTSPAFPETPFPRLQILTIESMLAGATIEFPRLKETTFKQAPKSKPNRGENLFLNLT